MKVIDVRQGSEEWKVIRAKYRGASNAPVMMGVSSKMRRSELVRLIATGDEREYSAWVLANLLDKGHQIEEQARPIAEAIVGETLYTPVGSCDSDYLFCSFDGLTLLSDVSWECKSRNKEKLAAIAEGRVHDDDDWQVQQNLVVSGAGRCLYMVTDGTPEGTATLWVTLRPDAEKVLRAAWQQFDADVAAYQHVEEAPRTTGTSITELPALIVTLTGGVTNSNLPAFRDAATAFIASINTELTTDQHFANAENAVKFCDQAEKKLALVKQQALEQTVSIAAVFRTINEISENFRSKRLDLEKLVKSRKEAIRDEIRMGGVKALAAHVETLNRRLGRSYMPQVPADFALAMKGLRTITTLRDAVNTTLAHAKIAANEIADRIELNMKRLAALPPEHAALFPDEAQLVLGANDHFELLVRSRIDAADKRREEEREKIRQEEQARAQQAQAPQTPAPQPATAPAQQAAPQPAPTGRTGRVMTADEIESLGARESLQVWLDTYGKLRSCATIAAAIRSFLNEAGGRKKKAA